MSILLRRDHRHEDRNCQSFICESTAGRSSYPGAASEAGPAQVLKISEFSAPFLEIIVQQQVDILRGRRMLIYPPLAGLLFS